MAPSLLMQRRLGAEQMDRPGLDAGEHVRALDGLRRLNIVSGATRRLWRDIAALTSVQPGERLQVLDVACGGGDIALGLWRLACRRGVDLRVVGLDISPTACKRAAQRARIAGEAIRVECRDVVHGELSLGFDVVTCSLFLHHLPWDDAAGLLAKMAAAGRVLVVSDLRRSAVGYGAAHATCRLLTRSPIVHYDGPQSVANSFTVPEMRELCDAAGLRGASVRRAWPWRLMVTHCRS